MIGQVLLAAGLLLPEPVTKPVQVVRRPVKVSIVAEEMPTHPGPDCPDDVRAMIDYWTGAMDKEVANGPDVIVLPEICDCWKRGGTVTSAFLTDWYMRRGDRILKAFSAYARQHRCYLVYATTRNRPDGKWANSSILIDRDGDVAGVYDKVYPTDGEIVSTERPIVPGKGPVVVDTDFGRVGFLICFDVNFRELAHEYAKLKPDVLFFSSHFDGDFARREWARITGAWVVASANEGLPKTICDPCGGEWFREHAYFRTVTRTINTSCGVFHLDGNWPKLTALVKKYGSRIAVHDPGQVGTVLLTAETPELSVPALAKEAGLEYATDYFARSKALREKAAAQAAGEGKAR